MAEQDADEDDSDSASPKAKWQETTNTVALHVQMLTREDGEAMNWLIFKIDETRADSGFQLYAECSN